MELKTWLMIVRVLNCVCSAMLVGFQIWFIVDLFQQHRTIYGFMLRIWAPIFIILIAFIILMSEFKYQKSVQYFKFLQVLPGLAFFNLFIASIVAFEFSLVNDTASIVLASLFTLVALLFFIFHCLKPSGSQSLLASQ